MKAGSRGIKSALIRVIVYIDALNFYYGALQGRRWKWLDLEKWASAILPDGSRLAAVHYCTSMVRSEDNSVAERQGVYLEALQARGFWAPPEERLLILPNSLSNLAKSGGLQIHYGQHVKACVFGRLPGDKQLRKFIVRREKQTDINLASRMVADAAQDRFDCAILVANDSDYVGACSIVRREFDKNMLLFPPLLPDSVAQKPREGERRIVKELVESVGGMENVRTISLKSLTECQFPHMIPGTKICRPESW